MSAAPLNDRYNAFNARAELLLQRAAETFLWALPLINTLGMKFGSEEMFGAGYNVLPIWRERPRTPGADVVYAMSTFDVAAGPMVLEAPPGLQGTLLDFWQRPIPGPTIRGRTFLGDIGLAGPDSGEGGTFLIVPPGYDEPAPDGTYLYRSATNNVFVFLFAFDDRITTVMEAVKIYPLNEKWPKPMIYRDGSGAADILPRSDSAAFDQLKWLLDHEADDLADPDSMDKLASIGIVKGEPFTPNSQMRAILDRAAKAGRMTAPRRSHI